MNDILNAVQDFLLADAGINALAIRQLQEIRLKSYLLAKHITKPGDLTEPHTMLSII